MSEKSSKVLVTPHNQAFAKGEVLKINGLYWRVLGAQDAEPYAKLLLLGVKSKESPYIYSTKTYRYPPAFESEFSYTDPFSGDHMINAYVPYYSKDQSPKDTSQQSADSSCVKWASEQEFSKYLDTVGCPVHTVYRVVDSISTAQKPALVCKHYYDNIHEWRKQYVVPVGISRQTGILRKCRLLSVTDIIDYFNKNEVTEEELYNDLLGGKHYKEFSTWSVNTGGILYDAVRYPTKPSPNEGLEGLVLSYFEDGRTVVKEYGVSGDNGAALLVINLNLREYRNWEKATDW